MPCYDWNPMRVRHSFVSLVVGALLLWAAPASAAKTTAAVMPLGKGAGPASFDGLGRALADMMVTDLSTSKTLQLVERTKLKLVLDELKLAKSGFLDKSTAQKLGRGLGAELVITGSFSVIGEKFVIDIRIISVKTGAILKAARSDGVLDDFIAIEKDVVEKLMAGLAIKLTPGARRKLLMAAPTESVKALASYGRGLDASEEGLHKQAKAAFEEALKQDPDFAKASLALRDLATMATTAGKVERTRYKENIQRGLDKALRAIPSELTRAKNFKDTQASMLDFTIRQHLLDRDGQYCKRYAELKHYLLRRNGEMKGWFIGLKSNYRDSWTAGEDVMEARAKQLGVAGPETLFGPHARGLMFEASPDLTSGKNLLLYGHLSPEKFDTILGLLEQCHAPNVQIAEFNSLMKIVKKWKWIDKPLSSTYGVGPSTYTARDSLDLYWAYLRALHRGVDSKVRARSDAVLARHPEGDKDRRSIINRIKEIVSAGEAHERTAAARMKSSEKEIVKDALAAQKQDAKRLHTTNPVCQTALIQGKYSIDRTVESHSKMRSRISPDRRRTTINQLASSIATLRLAGCFRKGKSKPLSPSQLISLVKAGIARPHPAKLKDKSCLEQTQKLRQAIATTPATSGSNQLVPHVAWLHRLRTQRCLLP